VGKRKYGVIVNIQVKSSELIILIAASAMSLLANLPEDMLGNLVDKKMLLIALTALIVVAMFRYLQMFLLLLITILAIGANLPAELASALGISKMALIVSLGALIAAALMNRVVRVLPMGSDISSAESPDERQSMLEAIAKGDQVTLHRMLVMNMDVNFTQNGTTPLHLAAEKGYPDIVRLLIKFGADFRKKNAEGKTALEIALSKKKFIQTTEILHSVSKPYLSVSGQEESRRGDAEIWQSQLE
jgi:Ankyrin repeats (many copies)